MVALPDTSMLVVDSDGKYLKVAALHPELRKLVVIGWIETSSIKGKTIHNFNWGEFLSQQKD